MTNISRKIRLFLFICTFTILFILIYHIHWYSYINETPSPISIDKPYRGCIATLIRSDNLVSLNKLLNMLNSLKLYFKNISNYKIYLFHEPTLTNDTKSQILNCASKLKIEFYEILFNVTIESNRSGYASMCQFWSYDIWFKYDIIKTQCDYLMRFDDDSYLINSTEYDLFQTFHNKKLDYAYRIIYHDNNGLDFIQNNLRSFLSVNQTRRGCIESLCTALNSYDGLAVYNNFFLIRTNLIYEHAIIEKYLQQLISMNAFYRYRIGDANIQTICLLLIDKPLKISFFNFPYGHNVHGSLDSQSTFTYYDLTAFMWHFQMRMPNVTCKKVYMASKYYLIVKDV